MGEFLTSEQIETFQKDGILVIENFLTQDEVTNMRAEILKLVHEMNPEEHRGVFSTTDNNSVQVKFTGLGAHWKPIALFMWFCKSH